MTITTNPAEGLLSSVLHFAVYRRWLVVLFTLFVATFGFKALQLVPVDAVPDITNIQVQINTEAPGYTPIEVEQQITFVVENAISGTPDLEYTRSLSRYGLSQVTVVFKDETDIYFARQRLTERLLELKDELPAGITPTLGPVATGLGEVVMYTLRHKSGDSADKTLLRTVQEWIIKPQLRTVQGVTEINTFGGYLREFHVLPDPERLLAFDLTLADISAAIRANGQSSGAGYIERNGEQLLIRAPGQFTDAVEIGLVPLKQHQGVPLLVHDVAEVQIGHELRSGAATENGEETVLGIAVMLKGENSRTVAQNVTAKLRSISEALPPEIELSITYDRSNLVNATILTVRKNLIGGALLVIGVLFFMLSDVRAALITSLVIPLSMLFTVSIMAFWGMSANLMSLGALDFGLIVDGSVIIVENCIRRLRLARKASGRSLSIKERLHIVFDASREVRRATIFGELIIMIVYLPILTLTGVEGKMFRPMASTVVLALLGAMILSLTFVPAAMAIAIRDTEQEEDNRIIRVIKAGYRPLLEFSLKKPLSVLAVAAASLVIAGALSFELGQEFVPELDEQDIALHAIRIPGTGLSQAVSMQKTLERELLENIEEIERVFSRIGTPEIATDPMPPEMSDAIISFKSRSLWPNPLRPKQDVIEEIKVILEALPGNSYEFTQPIQMRFNELIAGVRSDLAVKIYGDDLRVLEQAAGEIQAKLKRVPGATDIQVEPTSGLPTLNIVIDREKSARFGLSLQQIQEVIQTAIAGRHSGQLIQGDRRFPVIVRLPEHLRTDLEVLRRLPIALPRPNGLKGHFYIPLNEVAELSLITGPTQISRENGKRRLVVTANVEERDLGSFVDEVHAVLTQSTSLPPGYWIEYGGQYEHLLSARHNLYLIVPLSLGLIFLLLYASLHNIRECLVVFTGVPLAMAGGVLALWLRDIPFSISAGVGFIALSGVSVLNALVMVTFIRARLEAEGTVMEAIRSGSLSRLRPVLMTALVASLGFIPMALSTGVGAEVQRPLATVVIGGIFSSTPLTLFVIPALYRLWFSGEARLNESEQLHEG